MNKTLKLGKWIGKSNDVSLLATMKMYNHLPYPEFRAKVGEAMQEIADKKFANYNKITESLLKD